jgi:hypothetical protein
MNKRIKELAQKATKEVWGTNPHNGAPEFQGYELDQEKFADSIVRMCADYADMAYDARCKYVGDYVAEAMGYGEEQGITTWRMAE